MLRGGTYHIPAMFIITCWGFSPSEGNAQLIASPYWFRQPAYVAKEKLTYALVRDSYGLETLGIWAPGKCSQSFEWAAQGGCPQYRYFARIACSLSLWNKSGGLPTTYYKMSLDVHACISQAPKIIQSWPKFKDGETASGVD